MEGVRRSRGRSKAIVVGSGIDEGFRSAMVATSCIDRPSGVEVGSEASKPKFRARRERSATVIWPSVLKSP